MMRYYDSRDEVHRRLSNGIIFYKGEPVEVVEGIALKGSKAKFGVYVRNLPDRDKSWKVGLDDPDLNFRDMKIGYINTADSVRRILRSPQRTVQQSLNESNCYVLAIVPEEEKKIRYGDRDTILTLTKLHPTAVESLAGRYPTLKEARKAVEDGEAKARAFHRDFCFVRIMGVPALWYKLKPVGLTLDPKSLLKYNENTNFLKELLAEHGIGAAS
jgi:hypothetical protein